MVPGEMHYVIQRGHNRQAVFLDDDDRASFLAMLRDAAAQYGVAIHAYALLSSDVHLLMTPREADSLSRLMQSLGRRYVAAVNRRHGRTGTLWAGRFRAAPVDGSSLGLQAMVALESQPVRIGQVAAPELWPWSSAAHHLGHRRDTLITEHFSYWNLGNTPFERELAYAHKLRDGWTLAHVIEFETSAQRGHAIGPDAFRTQVAGAFGRSMMPRRRGRPAR